MVTRRTPILLGIAIFALSLAAQLTGERSSEQQVTIKVIEARTAKPMRKLDLVITFSNGQPNNGPLLAKNVVRATTVRTNDAGLAIVLVPRPLPKFVDVSSLEWENPWVGPIPLDETLRSGFVYVHGKPPTKPADVSAEAGYIKIVNHKLTTWERMRREFP